MDTPENLLHRTHRKRVISALLNGKKSATQLQTLLSRGPHLVSEELALEILTSFTDALFQLQNCGAQILADSGGRKLDDSGEKSKEPANKVRRGCYKRRKSSDSWTIMSESMRDDHAWRKYGQKWILNSKYPRCYFRCTHKNTQGCKAKKQVQRMDDSDKDEYRTIYFGQHTCKDSLMAHYSAQSSECITQDDDDDHSDFVIVNQQDREFIKSRDTQIGISETKSSEDNVWGNDKCMISGSSGTSNLDVDDSCFANLDNLFRSEEMRRLLGY